MYFLSDEERRYLVGKLLPQARRHEVHPELRGWSWREPPLSPPYDVRLGVFEVAGRYCNTGRDLYLRRVMGVRAGPNRAMREGAALHRALAEVVLRAKQTIYATGAAGCLEALGALGRSPNGTSTGVGPVEGEGDEVGRRVQLVQAFEARRVVSRVEDVLARQPRVGTDSLAALALPVTLEQQLDGSLLGLSAHLSVDAVALFGPVVYDVKFGRREEFHRLGTTAYALVLECLYEHPVDAGCVVYVRFEGDRVLVERDLHLVDDELRQTFLEERDERMRMVAEEIDPGVGDRCVGECPYAAECRRGRPKGA